MDKVRLLYRADGGYPIGSGHILRAVRILRELSNLCPLDSTIMMANDIKMIPIAATAPASLHILPPRSDLDAIKPILNAAPVLESLSDQHYDLCLIDMLDTPERDMRSLADTGVKLVTFDDRGPGRVYADAIFNVLVEEPDQSMLKPVCRLFEGCPFAMLDPQFAALGNDLKVRNYDSSGDILVTMGGVDAAGLTVKTARALKLIRKIRKVIFVGGAAYPHCNELELELKSAPWEWEIRLNVPGLLDLFLWCDLALIAGGLTMYEACRSGTPALAICQPIDHQFELARKLSLAGGMETVGYGLNATEEEIALRTERLLNSPSERRKLGETGGKLVDGQGVRRTALALLELLDP